MRRELQKYKKNTFDKLTIKFNNDKKALTIYFNNLINFVLTSRLSQNVKIVQINILRASYITHLNKLTNMYNNEVNRINAYQPNIPTIQNTPTIQNIDTNFKNKNALLIGCNYNNTSYKLNGCINDVNNIKSIINKTGFNNINILTDETDKKPNKSNILSELTKLLTNSNNNDLLFFCTQTYSPDVNLSS